MTNVFPRQQRVDASRQITLRGAEQRFLMLLYTKSALPAHSEPPARPTQMAGSRPLPRLVRARQLFADSTPNPPDHAGENELKLL
jgi:hypothetical protein